MVIMNMLDWRRSSRHSPCAAASTAPRTDSTLYKWDRNALQNGVHPTLTLRCQLHWDCSAPLLASMTRASSTTNDLQEPLSVPVPWWLLHVPPSLQSPWSSESDSAMLNTITDAHNLSELHALTCQGQEGLFQQTRECHLEDTVLPSPPI